VGERGKRNLTFNIIVKLPFARCHVCVLAHSIQPVQIFLSGANLVTDDVATAFGALADLESLVWVDLSKNTIGGELSAMPTGLKLLRLNDNGIHGIDHDEFQKLISLEHLDLAGNNLSGVRVHRFSVVSVFRGASCPSS
jgi:hypothetical protein